MSQLKEETHYFLYDSRYRTDPDNATVYTVSNSLKEAREDRKTMFEDGVIVKVTSIDNVITKGVLIE